MFDTITEEAFKICTPDTFPTTGTPDTWQLYQHPFRTFIYSSGGLCYLNTARCTSNTLSTSFTPASLFQYIQAIQLASHETTLSEWPHFHSPQDSVRCFLSLSGSVNALHCCLYLHALLHAGATSFLPCICLFFSFLFTFAFSSIRRCIPSSFIQNACGFYSSTVLLQIFILFDCSLFPGFDNTYLIDIHLWYAEYLFCWYSKWTAFTFIVYIFLD